MEDGTRRGTRYFNTGCACLPRCLSFGNRTQNSRVVGVRLIHQTDPGGGGRVRADGSVGVTSVFSQNGKFYSGRDHMIVTPHPSELHHISLAGANRVTTAGEK